LIVSTKLPKATLQSVADHCLCILKVIIGVVLAETGQAKLGAEWVEATAQSLVRNQSEPTVWFNPKSI
jgi:hypothetical protein